MSESSASTVTVLDTGIGNLGNLSRALEWLGASVVVTEDAETVAESSRLLLPGVGAFRPPRERLRGALEEALSAALARGAWLLGICVGYQLLFEESVEFGHTDGLALLPGRISRLPDSVPLPHIGWNRLQDLQEGHPLLAGLEDGDYTYFVHSFAPEGVPESAILASTLHGRAFPSIVAQGRVLGTQFHPEKSGAVGLRLLQAFLDMTRNGAGAAAESPP